MLSKQSTLLFSIVMILIHSTTCISSTPFHSSQKLKTNQNWLGLAPGQQSWQNRAQINLEKSNQSQPIQNKTEPKEDLFLKEAMSAPFASPTEFRAVNLSIVKCLVGCQKEKSKLEEQVAAIDNEILAAKAILDQELRDIQEKALIAKHAQTENKLRSELEKIQLQLNSTSESVQKNNNVAFQSQKIIESQATMLKSQMNTIRELQTALDERRNVQETTETVHAALEELKAQLKHSKLSGKVKTKQSQAQGSSQDSSDNSRFVNIADDLSVDSMQGGKKIATNMNS